jgi:hypothetical protein
MTARHQVSLLRDGLILSSPYSPREIDHSSIVMKTDPSILAAACLGRFISTPRRWLAGIIPALVLSAATNELIPLKAI